jgi:hypothetical protein
MESGWFVNSNLSNSEGSAAALPGRSYQISPIALPSWRALLQGRRSTTTPQGFGKLCSRMFNGITLTPYSTETTFFGRSAASCASGWTGVWIAFVSMCCHMIKAADLHDNPINPSYRPSVGEMHRVLQHNSTDQPEVHEIAREMRRLTNEYSERLLIARSTCRASG